MRILVKFPTRERPYRFRSALKLMKETCVHDNRVGYLFTLDEDDKELEANIRTIEAFGPTRSTIDTIVGRSASKIDAVNRDIASYAGPWDILLVMSDDMLCEPGWDIWVHDAMERFYPSGNGLLWFFDGLQKDICTIPCMGRIAWEADGYVYNPVYRSVFADDEQTNRAIASGTITKIDHVLMRHNHPAWNNDIKPDGLYRKNESKENWSHDEKIYRQRHKAGFP